MSDQLVEARCFICGYDNPHGLHEHHIHPQAEGGSDEPENTTWLCGSCHQALHNLYGNDDLAGNLESGDDGVDAQGDTIQPEHSIDRRIHKRSPHVTIEPFCFDVSLEYIERDPFWDRIDWQVIDDDSRPYKGCSEYIKKVCTENAENVKGKLKKVEGNKDDQFVYYIVESENKRQKPTIRIVLDGQNRLENGWEWKHFLTRIHCSYCHTVFTGHEHADAARHLRMHHGISEVYECLPKAGREELFKGEERCSDDHFSASEFMSNGGGE